MKTEVDLAELNTANTEIKDKTMVMIRMPLSPLNLNFSLKSICIRLCVKTSRHALCAFVKALRR